MGEEKAHEGAKKELAVPIATAAPGYGKLVDRLNDMDQRVEFVAGELWQRQGEKIGFTMGLLYGVMLALVTYLIFLM
jgi:N5-methyltetrahydromethanopterin:coenzyme M methyltransferase subunit G